MQEGAESRVHSWCIKCIACRTPWPLPQCIVDAKDAFFLLHVHKPVAAATPLAAAVLSSAVSDNERGKFQQQLMGLQQLQVVKECSTSRWWLMAD
jgi:hypothetical protein